MASQEAAVLPLARQRWLARRQAAKWRHWAQRVLPGFDLVVAVSDEDLRALPVPPSQLAVIPNGVDTASFSPTPLPAGPRLVFTGALYTGPNRDGLQWFCREVLPLIRRQQPNATLTIAGMAPTADVAALGAVEGVNVLSDVADIRPFIGEARVVVVPLRVGSGSRLKILEALAAGRPVVSTTVGAEGLDLEPGRHLLLADEPAAFAEAVCRLIGDEASARSLVGPGRRAVEELYAWPDIGERFVDAVLRSGGARSTRSR
jgi:glycosyltransferase involved in cell wall biosynthesis